MMLAHLLARAGVDVLVLEKHADFLRDFRGDTIHPSTLELMHELGVLDDFLTLPHQKVAAAQRADRRRVDPVRRLLHLPMRCPFIAFMPQWDFLNFLAARAAARYPAFRLWMRAEVTDRDRGAAVAIVGLRVTTPSAARARSARTSSSRPTGAARSCASARRLPVRELGAPDGRAVVPAPAACRGSRDTAWATSTPAGSS